MEIVADTSSLIRLQHGDAVGVLEALFSAVWLPPAVVSECQHPSTNALLARSVFARSTESPTLRFSDLGAGEREAINLALDRQLTTLLIDDDKGFRRAQRYGLRPIGALTLLANAKALGALAAVRPVLDRMRDQGEGISENVYLDILAQVGEG